MTGVEPGPPKRSETDPPAADGPVDESPGSPPPRPKETADAAGRAANDPSVTEGGLVHEAKQAADGKPDGEVDTGDHKARPATLFS
ncbi:MAG TPA: hypothetical protein VG650_17015 [Mycobacteriales bacterium]|nr:hypothetical protein [Mycobacteriales bacterium]